MKDGDNQNVWTTMHDIACMTSGRILGYLLYEYFHASLSIVLSVRTTNVEYFIFVGQSTL